MTIPECDAGYRVLTQSSIVNDAAETEQHESKNSSLRSEGKKEDIEKGKSAFVSHGCLSCHSVGNLGGHFAPALDGESNLQIRNFLFKNCVTNTVSVGR